MKYESSILKRLVDTYGVVGNPRYISEIIKEFIVRGKECYPELFTYQSDWLAHIDEFGLNPTYTVNYTGQSIYAPNTLERPVKSAILKGQTLVNYANGHVIGMYLLSGALGKYSYSIATTPKNLTYKKYTIIQPSKKANRIAFTIPNIKEQKINAITNGVFLLDLTNETEDLANQDLKLSVFDANGSASMSINEDMFMIVEGDYTNVDIPYFEGMQSVKMPVLTTIGKNLFSGYNEFIKVNNSESLYLSSSDTVGATRISFKIYDENKKLITSNNAVRSSVFYYREADNKWMLGSDKTQLNTSFKLADNVKYIVFENAEYDNVQLEEGSTKTTYEPYKSNILTVNDDVTLRGIGKIQDELNCLTGEVTQRIKEIVLDGSENWAFNPSKLENTYDYYLTLKDKNSHNYKSTIPLISINEDKFGIVATGFSGVNIPIRIERSKLASSSVESFKQWLAQNPITVQYQIATETIKTVDLTILDQNGQSVEHLKSFNGGTHVYTSSLEGSLVPSVDISVVTNLEETLKMCSLDGNTL